tara:strand:- start:417 stop:638 length:222 start_codon:yes stop_codon:yes gene_type:complete
MQKRVMFCNGYGVNIVGELSSPTGEYSVEVSMINRRGNLVYDSSVMSDLFVQCSHYELPDLLIKIMNLKPQEG